MADAATSKSLLIFAQDRRPGNCTTNPFDLLRLPAKRGSCPYVPVCGPGPQSSFG